MKQCRGQAASERAVEKRRSERAAWGGSGAVFEAPALVACLDDIAMMGETVEQCGRHLRIAEDAWPFTECEIGRDDDRGSLVDRRMPQRQCIRGKDGCRRSWVALPREDVEDHVG